jgi:predicted PP-loop superfamily ATPase
MLFELMKQEDVFIKKNGYTLTVDCFFEKQAWREKSVFDVGGEKAAYDFGCLLIKNLSKQKIHYNRIISLPTLFVIAPVPKNHLSS